MDLHSAIYKLVKAGVIDFTGKKWGRLYARKSNSLPTGTPKEPKE
jgi:hypothetical protein